MENDAIHVLIVGTGMYVCGRGTDGFGTVLPALHAWARDKKLGQVHVAGTHPSGTAELLDRNQRLSERTRVSLQLSLYPENGKPDPDAFHTAIARLPRPACAIVVVPDHLHGHIAGACIEAGLPTLVVKPLAPTVAEARQLIQRQKAAGVYAAVEFHKRYDRANQLLKTVLTTGKIGKPLYFIVEYSQRKIVPSVVFRAWVQQTNIFQYLGVHYVDVIQFVTKARPLRAMANAQAGWLRSQGIDTDDAIHATVEWQNEDGNRFFSYFFTNWIDPQATSAMSDQRIKVIGTLGRFESDQKKRGLTVVTDADGLEEPNPDFCTPYLDAKGAVIYRGYGIESIHTFLQDVEDLRNRRVTIAELEMCRPTFTDCLASTAVVEAVNTSLSLGGQWVGVDG